MRLQGFLIAIVVVVVVVVVVNWVSIVVVVVVVASTFAVCVQVIALTLSTSCSWLENGRNNNVIGLKVCLCQSGRSASFDLFFLLGKMPLIVAVSTDFDRELLQLVRRCLQVAFFDVGSNEIVDDFVEFFLHLYLEDRFSS